MTNEERIKLRKEALDALINARRLLASSYPMRPSANTAGDGRTMRLGRLIPGIEADHWWRLAVTDADEIMADALNALTLYGSVGFIRRLSAPTKTRESNRYSRGGLAARAAPKPRATPVRQGRPDRRRGGGARRPRSIP